ncbi:hypothetical protein GOBAR_AA06493 [Gossypium barbadense]|uniref:Germin-like protein n=1 Tax=Gossypium barbadense TaxID=3634 RepID=A0A2P5YEP4_GOSBA|nr:hypothetical protein GOBAR_AA06493 [Gossypium barbadense]
MMKRLQLFVAAFAILACNPLLASASDPSPLQDFCVAINDTKNGEFILLHGFTILTNLTLFHAVFVNGKFCKDPKLANAEDFFYSRLNIPRNTSNPIGSTVTPINVAQISRMNTFSICLVRIDYAPYGGLNPPHMHPRATEILVVLEGTLYVDFVTSNTDICFITKVLNPGDVFVFPIGLIHFQFNIGNTKAVAFAGLPVGQEYCYVSPIQIWWDNN